LSVFRFLCSDFVLACWLALFGRLASEKYQSTSINTINIYQLSITAINTDKHPATSRNSPQHVVVEPFEFQQLIKNALCCCKCISCWLPVNLSLSLIMSTMGRAEFAVKMHAAARRKVELQRRHREVQAELQALDKEVGQLMNKIDAATSDLFYEVFPDIAVLLCLDGGRAPDEVAVSPAANENKGCDLPTVGTKDAKLDRSAVETLDSDFLDGVRVLEIEFEVACIDAMKQQVDGSKLVDVVKDSELEFPEPSFDSVEDAAELKALQIEETSGARAAASSPLPPRGGQKGVVQAGGGEDEQRREEDAAPAAPGQAGRPCSLG
jgi:hypothetical protein